jgi:hypothetical protein
MLALQMCVKGKKHISERRYLNFSSGTFSEILVKLNALAVYKQQLADFLGAHKS